MQSLMKRAPASGHKIEEIVLTVCNVSVIRRQSREKLIGHNHPATHQPEQYKREQK